MNLQEAISVAKSSPILSQFKLEDIGLVVQTFRMLAYSASHVGEPEPSFEIMDAFLKANPPLTNVIANVSYEVLNEVSKLAKPPTHEDYFAALHAPVDAILAIAHSGEVRPTLKQIQEALDNYAIEQLLDRTLTVLWIILYPNAPLINGDVHTIESYSQMLKEDDAQ